jgi:hypothetical protein
MLDAFKNRNKPDEEQIDELLSAYLDGALELDERKMLEARLQEDQELLAHLGVLRETKKALAQLPQVAVPRNFILSPSMVAPAKPTPRPRRRRTWPIFGWTTAAVTLLFLLVFAGDFFVVAPSLSSEPTQIAAEQAPVVSEAESLRDAAELTPSGGRATVVVERETVLESKEKVLQSAEAEPGATEQEMPAEAPQPGIEASAPAEAGEAEEAAGAEEPMMLQSAAAATEEGALPAAQETPPLPATATLGPEATPAPEVSEALVAPTVLPTAEAEKEMPSPTAPTPGQDEAGHLASRRDTPTPEPVAVLMVTPEGSNEAPVSEDLHVWLRVAEFGLGFAVIGLAIATLVLRRREM